MPVECVYSPRPTQGAVVTPLPVDMSELCIALEAESGDLRWFLDVGTGNVILVAADYAPEENDGLSVADLEQNVERFRVVPAADPNDLVGDMRAFAASLTDLRLKESLDLALSAPRPERRFRAALGWLPETLERWHSFRQAQCEARARGWLQSLGIAPVARPEARD